MPLAMGVDPGMNGAFCVVDDGGNIVLMRDMPTWTMVVRKKPRTMLDMVGIDELFSEAELLGVSLVILENVAGGRRGQGQATGFTLGRCCGALEMACIKSRIPLEPVDPATWKRILAVPGKRLTKADRDALVIQAEIGASDEKAAKKQMLKAAEHAIIDRADKMFPQHRELWRGPKGGYKLDRAEAALIARFGLVHVLKALDPSKHDYRNAGMDG